MKQGILIDRYNKLSESFALYFQKTLKDQGIEDVHQLRVTVKKLRAIWALMESVTDGNWTKEGHSSLISNLFSEAGELREAQINLVMIARFKVRYLIPYTEYLRTIQRNASQRLLIEMKAFDFNRFQVLNRELSEKMKDYPRDIILRQSISYVLKKTHKVYRIKDELPNDRRLHKIRIHLKAVAEILNIITKIEAKSGLKKYLNKVKSLNRQIGKWHDYVILIKSIKQFVNTDPEKNDNKRLQSLIIRIENQQVLRQEKIINLLSNHITQQQIKQIENLLYSNHQQYLSINFIEI